jgi:hypothetical protein
LKTLFYQSHEETALQDKGASGEHSLELKTLYTGAKHHLYQRLAWNAVKPLIYETGCRFRIWKYLDGQRVMVKE